MNQLGDIVTFVQTMIGSRRWRSTRLRGDEGEGGVDTMLAVKPATRHRLFARYSRSWLIRDNESGRAHEFGDQSFVAPRPPPTAVQAPGRGGRAGATLVLLISAQKYVPRLDLDQKVNKRVAPSHVRALTARRQLTPQMSILT